MQVITIEKNENKIKLKKSEGNWEIGWIEKFRLLDWNKYKHVAERKRNKFPN